MNEATKQIKKPIFLYNPTTKPVYIKDLDLKIGSGDTVDVFAYSKNITDHRFLLSAERGSLRDNLLSGSIILADSNNKHAPQYAKFTESKKPISRRQLITPIAKQKNSNFIERLQRDFGDRILTASEHDVAKNTEELINSIDFDGFDDPLE